jgi:sialidase-1
MYIQKIWSSNPDGEYSRMRIPGILVTSRGEIIIWNEARESESDWAEMDILMRKSLDGGKTWSEPACLAKGSAAHPTVNNPVMAEDAQGALHFLYCENYGTRGGRILHRESRDGEAWSEPRDISSCTLPEYRNVFALGPGHGICTQKGVLVFPFWLVPKKFGKEEKAHAPSEVGVLYSKDSGKTWGLSPLLSARENIVSPNETVAAELPSGELYLAIRQNAPARAHALLSTDFASFTNYSPVEDLPDPVCFGSVINAEGKLIFVNCAHEKKRQNVTLRESRDGGKTWRTSLTVDETRGGYADIAYDRIHRKIFVLYENEYGKELYFASADINEI